MAMRKSLTCWFVAGLGAALFAADAPPASVPFAQLPPAVQKAIQLQAVNGKVGEISRDDDNGSVSYVVEITKGTQTRDYTFDENGTPGGAWRWRSRNCHRPCKQRFKHRSPRGRSTALKNRSMAPR